MQVLPKAVRQLIETFERLPGIGPKSAQRLVFYLLHNPESELQTFAQRLLNLKQQTVICSQCHMVSEQDPCQFCTDTGRDQSLLCVVEEPLDAVAIESSGVYRGLYHVLHGSIRPLQNIGPEQLFLYDLAKRVSGVEELVLATNPTMEGEATALFIVEYLKNQGVKKLPIITRIGHGLPVGADIEYADGVTLKRALEGRREL